MLGCYIIEKIFPTMKPINPYGRLDRPVDHGLDHVLGPAGAEITLVEYGSYACPHCRAANERIAQARDQLGDRVCYAFRHRPLTDNSLAFRAAELTEFARTPEEFWAAHIKLMTRSPKLTEDDLVAVAADLRVTTHFESSDSEEARRARARIEADVASSRASDVRFTPAFFINRRLYEGPWDESSLVDAMLGTLGHRVLTAALDFGSWGASAGILLVLATLVAIAVTNSSLGSGFENFWNQQLGVTVGGGSLSMSLLHWINDGLLTIFFLVVGLEVKREMTVGHLASRRSAALPIAAALGGMTFPALLYVLVVPAGALTHAWVVPMATDTAFTIALMAMMGPRVPVELRIFLTAAAIVNDIGAIVIVTFFYSGDIHAGFLIAALTVIAALAFLSRSGIYVLTPYILLGVALWVLLYASDLHPTLAGVVLALFIPTRPPADLSALMTQASAVIASEARHEGEVLRRGPSAPTLRALNAIHDRIESPADRLLRYAGARSSYVVLPLFAIANTGVAIRSSVLHGRVQFMVAIIIGLVLGKSLGVLFGTAAAVWARAAVKPQAISWRQVAGAGALAGSGFTTSLFIAGQSMLGADDLSATKIAVFAASIISAGLGTALLWGAQREGNSSDVAVNFGTRVT